MIHYIFLDQTDSKVMSMHLRVIDAECFAVLTNYRYHCMRVSVKWWQSGPKLGKPYLGPGTLRFNGPAAGGIAPPRR